MSDFWAVTAISKGRKYPAIINLNHVSMICPADAGHPVVAPILVYVGKESLVVDATMDDAARKIREVNEKKQASSVHPLDQVIGDMLQKVARNAD